ncbi:hypothetical protein RBH29_12940 [Herbivorax sp. ANBcel31]|uniref:hypothetical protein n=1 Tax=Herbivorax sp. ANBcel31 TaxID=3069754 RepID=UPI0027B65CCA|nr:hypothetical protein [Herbivorax sp. ANBcel31]MDQ2087332.1 hypothetical protein [Herbivorax sp. ANBcel31]
MEYLENAFKFFGKYMLLIVPLLIISIVRSIMSAPGFEKIDEALNEMSDLVIAKGDIAGIDFHGVVVQLAPSFDLIIHSFLLALLLSLFVLPATYGMIIKGYETGKTGLGAFFTSFKKYFLKYMKYFLGVVLFFVVVGVILFFVLLMFAILFSINLLLGLIFLAIVAIVALIMFCALFNILNIWFIAMAWDNMKVFSAMSKSYELVKSYFWSSVGITFTIGFLYITINALIGGVLEAIFIVGPVVKSFFAVMCIYVLIVFGFEIYRDRTNKETAQRDYL